MQYLSLVVYFVCGMTLWLLAVSNVQAWVRGTDCSAPWHLLALALGGTLAIFLHD